MTLLSWILAAPLIVLGIAYIYVFYVWADKSDRELWRGYRRFQRELDTILNPPDQ